MNPSHTPRRCFYLHTISGCPAWYVPGKQICYINHYGNGGRLARSLKQIKAEQIKSMAWRTKQGYSNDRHGYGYRKVRLP